MREGDVLDDRFELGPRAGEGAMGVVHRARDRTTGETVAVKLLAEVTEGSEERFAREAAALARIEHPAVVRYLAHGVSRGAAYLAMEWLEGETLDARLRRGTLDAAEATTIAESLATALAALHARAIVHRDIKPSNLWLVGGDLTRLKILDLGIAHLADATRAMTRTGEVLGTPSYMAPEQVRGLAGIDARADVHAFGAVLFECVTGKPPFVGSDLLAIALKVLLETPPRLADVRPGVPLALDRAVVAALRKTPSDRPKDGADLLARLRGAGDAASEGDDLGGAALTTGEQKLFTIVLAEPAPSREGSLASTMKMAEADDTTRTLREIARAFAAGVEALAGRAHAIVLSGFASARDQAAQAASCALRVAARLPKAAIAIATGRGEVSLGAVTGVVIDRAVGLVRAIEREGDQALRGIRIDQATAGLLDDRFEVGGDARGLALLGEREVPAGGRVVAGKKAPFVGRDREVMTLEALAIESFAESAARVALITAPAGTGKSRLLHEALARLGARDEPFQTWSAHASPLGAGSPFALLAGLARAVARVGIDEPPHVQRTKLAARVGRHLPADKSASVADFLAEILGAGDDEAPSTEIRAARQDPKALGERVQRAFVTWLEAEAEREPVVIALEDLHWGDRASVAAIDLALKRLAELPLVVLAFARPEVHAVFPDLWRDRGVLSLELGGLSKRAATKLVKELLGDGADEEHVQRIVARAEGNAFFLEELVRAERAGAADAPETVLAMIGARLAALDPGSRRVLRAASVFGRVFPRGGLDALVGDAAIVGPHLDDLERREVVVRQPDARLGDDAWAFVHELARDAAYAMLTADDRALGHRLAGTWLWARGEKDPLLLAEHFELGGARDRASEAWARAAFLAFEANDFTAVLDRARRAESSGLAGLSLSRLRRLEAEVHRARQASAEAIRCAEDAMRLAPPKSAAWFAAATELVSALLVSSLFDRARSLAREVGAHDLADATAEQLVATLRVARTLFYANMYDEACALVARAETRAEATFGREPLVQAELAYEHANIAYFDGRLDVTIKKMAESADLYARAGDERRAWQTRGAVAYMLQLAGRYDRSAETYAACLASGAYAMSMDRVNYAVALARLGRFEEADALAREGVDLARGAPRLFAFAVAYTATIALARGDVEEAARAIADALATAPPEDLEAIISFSGIEASVRLAEGDAARALAAAERGLAALRTMPRVPVGELRLRWARAAALVALNEPRARDAVLEAHARLAHFAEKIGDLELRASFERIPEHARIAALSA